MSVELRSREDSGSPQRSCRPLTVSDKVEVRHANNVADGAGCTMLYGICSTTWDLVDCMLRLVAHEERQKDQRYQAPRKRVENCDATWRRPFSSSTLQIPHYTRTKQGCHEATLDRTNAVELARRKHIVYLEGLTPDEFRNRKKTFSWRKHEGKRGPLQEHLLREELWSRRSPRETQGRVLPAHMNTEKARSFKALHVDG